MFLPLWETHSQCPSPTPSLYLHGLEWASWTPFVQHVCTQALVLSAALPCQHLNGREEIPIYLVGCFSELLGDS